MFSFKLDKKKLDKMLPLCGNFIDIIYLNNKAIICSEDGICYSQVMFDAIPGDDNQGREGFRIETSILKRLAVNGRVEVYITDSEVELSMYGDSQDVIYKSKTPMMNSFVEFTSIRDLANKFDDYDYHSISSESNIIKLASKFNDVFVSEGRFCYIYHNNSYVFCKSALPAFCVDGKYFKNVTSLVEKFKLIENYLVFMEDNLFIYLKRNRMPSLSDLEFLVNSKAISRFELNFKRANYLINSLGAEDYKALLNLTANKLVVDSSKGSFEAKVEILNEKRKELSVEEKLKALSSPTPKPSRLLTDRKIKFPKWVFGVMGDYSNLVLYVKKSSCLLQFGTSYLVFQGGFVNEK